VTVYDLGGWDVDAGLVKARVVEPADPFRKPVIDAFPITFHRWPGAETY
jgi:hypothetical protein